MKITTRKLTETALMLALSTVLSLFTVAIELPFGGTVTPFSLVPLVVIGQRYDRKWAFAAAFFHGIIQACISLPKIMTWGLTWQSLVGTVILDYILAYACVGIAGLFRSGKYSVVIGTAAAMLGRFVCHYISGIVIFSSWMDEEIVAMVGSNIFIYSAAYNGFFMGPELLITLVGAIFVPRILHAIGGRM